MALTHAVPASLWACSPSADAPLVPCLGPLFGFPEHLGPWSLVSQPFRRRPLLSPCSPVGVVVRCGGGEAFRYWGLSLSLCLWAVAFTSARRAHLPTLLVQTEGWRVLGWQPPFSSWGTAELKSLSGNVPFTRRVLGGTSCGWPCPPLPEPRGGASRVCTESWGLQGLSPRKSVGGFLRLWPQDFQLVQAEPPALGGAATGAPSLGSGGLCPAQRLPAILQITCSTFLLAMRPVTTTWTLKTGQLTTSTFWKSEFCYEACGLRSMDRWVAFLLDTPELPPLLEATCTPGRRTRPLPPIPVGPGHLRSSLPRLLPLRTLRFRCT